jgi:Na+/H+ antiporter NhaD/arsenite permease-like protein
VSPEIISIIALAAMFVIATVLPINIGILAFVGAFAVGITVADMSEDDILAGFPGDLAVTLIGITYLFAIAQNNGTIEWLVRVAVRAVRGRLVAIPWVMFVVAGVLTAFGAVSPAAVAIIAPVALGFAYRFGISPLLMGIMVVHGAQAGGFSPISIYGSITNGIVDARGLEGSPLTLFLASLFFNLAVAVIGFVLFGGLPLLRRRADEQPEPTDATDSRAGATAVGGSESGGSGGTPGTRRRPRRSPAADRMCWRSRSAPRRTRSPRWSAWSASRSGPWCSTSTSASSRSPWRSCWRSFRRTHRSPPCSRSAGRSCC